MHVEEGWDGRSEEGEGGEEEGREQEERDKKQGAAAGQGASMEDNEWENMCEHAYKDMRL